MSDQEPPNKAGAVPYKGERLQEASQPVFYHRRESGFGPAALVALVFVVVAILAQSIFSNRDAFSASDAEESQTIGRQTGAAAVAPVQENPKSTPPGTP